jgi:inosine-uridine nucleoside N-ribohydrolase
MFGNLSERGNPGRWADFNTWSDPEAADMVVRSKLPTEMVGLDVTRQMTISSDEVDLLARSTDEVVRWLAQAMRFSVDYYRSRKRLDGCVINDVLTLGELLTPGILSFETLSIEVDLDEGEHLGHTRRTDGDVSSRLPVATAVDISGMREVLSRVFGRSWFDSSIGRSS